MLLIGYGIVRAGWYLWLPNPAQQEQVWVGNRYVYGGCLLSVTAAAWSHLRGHKVWVSVCAGLPGVLVGWTTWDDPYSLLRCLAAVVTFLPALAAAAEVILARGHRRRG
ncbi:hypothetical protein HNO81_06970 [Pseudarthrobacter sp. C4D7]|nr:hypothetical protein [Pseudarthrobacter sp. C4D7]